MNALGDWGARRIRSDKLVRDLTSALHVLAGTLEPQKALITRIDKMPESQALEAASKSREQVLSWRTRQPAAAVTTTEASGATPETEAVGVVFAAAAAVYVWNVIRKVWKRRMRRKQYTARISQLPSPKTESEEELVRQLRIAVPTLTDGQADILKAIQYASAYADAEISDGARPHLRKTLRQVWTRQQAQAQDLTCHTGEIILCDIPGTMYDVSEDTNREFCQVSSLPPLLACTPVKCAPKDVA